MKKKHANFFGSARPMGHIIVGKIVNVSVLIFLLFSCVACCLLFSCRPKKIDIQVESAPQKLVIFTQVIPNNFIVATVTKSFSPLEGHDSEDILSLLVSGAEVKITSNGQEYPCYEVNPGVYMSALATSFVNGQVYHLTAIYENDTVTSTSTMLPKVDFTAVLPSIDKSNQDSMVSIDLSFQDVGGVPNWYLLNFYKKGESTSGSDISIFFSNGSNALVHSMIISDQEFSGSFHSLVELEKLNPTDSIAVTLSNISKKYYDYLGKTLNGGGVFNQLNMEPMTYPTNIQNGYGFFNTFYPAVQFFDLGLY
jgi:hypothetical protein